MTENQKINMIEKMQDMAASGWDKDAAIAEMVAKYGLSLDDNMAIREAAENCVWEG